MGIAYAIWMGIAIIGITFAETIMYGNKYDFLKAFFMLLIAAGIMGLKFLGSVPSEP